MVADRARNAVADQRLDDAQKETQSSVNKLKKGNNTVTRASASIAASKSKATAKAMHPRAGQTGAYRIEEVQIDEKTLTAAETKKKEDIVKSMKDKSEYFEKRYPGRGKKVMYATATKMAKKIAEQALDPQPKTQQPQHSSQQAQQNQQMQAKKTSLERQNKQRTLQMLRQKERAVQLGLTDISV